MKKPDFKLNTYQHLVWNSPESSCRFTALNGVMSRGRKTILLKYTTGRHIFGGNAAVTDLQELDIKALTKWEVEALANHLNAIARGMRG